MSLVCICSYGVSWLGIGPTNISGSVLLPQRSQSWVHLDPQSSCLRPTPLKIPRLMPRLEDISGSCLFLRNPQTDAQTQRGPGSGLLPSRSQTCTQKKLVQPSRAWKCRNGFHYNSLQLFFLGRAEGRWTVKNDSWILSQVATSVSALIYMV